MWSWDWSEPFSLPGLIWGMITAIVLPAAAILLAVRIGNRQLKASLDAQLELTKREAERAETERRREKEERAAEGIEEALNAMSDLVEAAYTDDFREAAKIRIRSAGRLARIRRRLTDENTPVWDWIVGELSIVGPALEDTDQLHLPILGEQIVWRAAHFNDALVDWSIGKTDVQWFIDASELGHKPLAETTMPGDDEEQVGRG